MTADAKVGLLLGLVFIVIIAFLVNGLPNVFRVGEAAAAIETAVAELPMPNLILEGPVNDERLPHESGVPLRQPPAPTEVEVVQLPGGAVESPAEAADAAGQAPVAPVAGEPQVTRHTVKDGEYLTTIACMTYGTERGKRKSTIEAIAKANGLKSPDVLQIGQLLVLPDLDAVPARAAAAAAEGNTLVERITDMFERVKPKSIDKPKKEEFMEYVVQRGECLSEISTKHFGTWKRQDEIVKLNRDRVRDADDVMVGMILRLPKR